MVLMLYFIVVFLLVYAFSSPKKSVNSNTCTKMHKWIYKDDGNGEEYLVCSVCNKRPEDILNGGVEL